MLVNKNHYICNMKEKEKIKKTVEISNRKARFEYIILETYVAGIVLTGTEIKSLRQGRASIVDAYCYVSLENEVWIKNSHIAKYEDGTYLNHEERRERKLLLTKKQIRELREAAKKPGQTIVPLTFFIDENTKGRCKVLIGIAKGKRDYDKRQSIKEKEAKRDIDRFKKNFR